MKTTDCAAILREKAVALQRQATTLRLCSDHCDDHRVWLREQQDADRMEHYAKSLQEQAEAIEREIAQGADNAD